MAMNLSKNFSLAEFVFSDTADREGIDNTPPGDVVHNLQFFCQSVMQPMRDHLGVSIKLSSGFRCLDLNRLLKSKDTSYHLLGQACDGNAAGMTPFEFASAIAEMDVPYDKVILEFDRWVHIQGKPEGENPRRQLLTAYKNELNKTAYVVGIQDNP